MKKIRFYIGRALMHLGLDIMPSGADASVHYNDGKNEMSNGPFGIPGPPGESGIVEGYKLPCDVRLPPRTTIKIGCDLETLMVALRARDGKNLSFDTDQ